MRKQILTICLVAVSLSLSAGIPANYYQSADCKKDSALKTALHNIICGGSRYEYGNNQYHSGHNDYSKKGLLKAYGTWQAFYLTDRCPDGSVWDMYSYHTRYFVPRGTSTSCMEIEHCFPKSWWGGYGVDASKGEEYHWAYCDLHHLNPSDKPANTNKSNYPPHNITTADKFDNGSFRMGRVTEKGVSGADTTFTAFEPADEYKGDFARAWFYIATAYEDFTWVPNVCGSYMDNSSYLEFRPWLIETLLEWHRQDPVSKKEVNRMNKVSLIQGNRNPFIDYPDLVEYIWGDMQGKSVIFSTIQSTLDESYVFTPEYSYLLAYYPKNMTSTSCTPYWGDLGFEVNYTVKVYTKTIAGTGDTIARIPRAGYVKDTIAPIEGCSAATTSTSSAEGGSVRLKNGNTFTVSKFAALDNASNVVIRANQWGVNQTQSAQLNVQFALSGGQKLSDTTITISGPDEHDYRISMPKTAARVKLTAQVTGSGEANSITVQSVYIVKDDYKVDTNFLAGYPTTTEQTSITLQPGITYSGKDIFYTVTASAGQPNELRSNERRFQMGVESATKTVDAEPTLSAFSTGRVVCLEGIVPGQIVESYSLTGQLIHRQVATSTQMFFTMPQAGIYIFRSAAESIGVLVR